LEAFGRRPPNKRRRPSSGRHPKPFTEAEVKQTQSTLGGINLGESDSSTTVQCPRGAAVALNTTYPLHGLPAARSIIMERKSLSAPYYYCSDFGTFNIDCRPPCGLRFVISFF
jgi:hypothetical protein